ncbi:hypothetical protein GCK72_004009 [Caenorhabditis remanei]|uniref:Uncharacterized protein n=1 Tax=Caenorhabditis remanei TaxID=31234 RepID=A0A6A5HCG3_CAERE|nr:hypothetical protein GCK72_004009 [Caenorhabditis remanei]KAF1764063.1 hypothetical protein GCK72_004009 [Caenorhabditis remanei]
MFMTDSDSIPCTPSTSNPTSSATMRLCYNGATSLLAATACPAAFVDLDSIREEPSTPSRYSVDERDSDSVFFRESCSSSTFGSPVTEDVPTSTSSPFKFMESIQRKRKSMFRRNQSSSSLLSNEKRRTCRRPSLPSIPPTIDEMSSSVGHARSRRPSLHNDWTNEPHNGRGMMGMMDVSFFLCGKIEKNWSLSI